MLLASVMSKASRVNTSKSFLSAFGKEKYYSSRLSLVYVCQEILTHIFYLVSIMQLSLKDRIPLYDTNKIGVIYAGPGKHDNEAAILSNVCGSSRYTQFLAGLGTLLRLRDCPPAEIYTEGLDRNGAEGEFAYSWQYYICQGKRNYYFLMNASLDSRLKAPVQRV